MGQSLLLSGFETHCELSVLLKMGPPSHPLIAHPYCNNCRSRALPVGQTLSFMQNQHSSYDYKHRNECTDIRRENKAGQPVTRRGVRLERLNRAQA
jgi:hypothetical protein